MINSDGQIVREALKHAIAAHLRAGNARFPEWEPEAGAALSRLVEAAEQAQRDADEARQMQADFEATTNDIIEAAESRLRTAETALREIAGMSMQTLQWEGHLRARAALEAVTA